MSVVKQLLRLPLDMKLLGPNLIVIGVAAAVFGRGFAGGAELSTTSEYLVIGTLVLGAAVNFLLVRLALSPVKAMQFVAEQIANGNTTARVKPSIIADPGLARLGLTFNDALEHLAEARERVRRSGARVVFAQENERSKVARELHDSIGQTIAAASLHAAAVVQAVDAPGLQRLENAQEVSRLLRVAMGELRSLSREIHPRVADDLGLPAALESLRRSTMERSRLDIQLSVRDLPEPISLPLASTFYRIAENALRNIELNAAVGTVAICVWSENGVVQMEINDYCIFEGPAGRNLHASLASAGEKLSLLGGELLIERNFRGGTRVTARLKQQLEAA